MPLRDWDDAPVASAPPPAIAFTRTKSTWDVTVALSDAAIKHGVTVDDIRGTDRRTYLNAARRDVATALRKLGYSYPEIGKALGGRHHSTIMYLLGFRRSPEARHRQKVKDAERYEARVMRTAEREAA